MPDTFSAVAVILPLFISLDLLSALFGTLRNTGWGKIFNF